MMAGEYKQPITIHDAIKGIGTGDFLLPAIQRKFTWSHTQICVLFDSIMRGYPINTFMFWHVYKEDIKKEFRFYRFLENYCQRFDEENPEVNKVGDDNFFAVVDGQQRLTSIYIGLKGTFAYKTPRKWWPKSRDESVLPTRKLYLNLAASKRVDAEDDDNDELMLYDFRFLSKPEFESLESKHLGHWYRIGEILELAEVEDDEEVLAVVREVLNDRGLVDSEFARQTLKKLYCRVRLDPVIHYFEEQNQDMRHVLDIFIRTNKGGTELSFSDLLMSITVANWKEDARKQIDSLVHQIWTASDLEFNVNRDFVLKTCLALTDSNVRFKVDNFKSETVDVIEQMWPRIKDSILATLRLIKAAGINDHSLRAKNAVIPICYYLMHQESNGQPLYKTINNPAYHQEKRRTIIRWLNIALLKSLFSGQSDGVLTKLIGKIQDQRGDGDFPLREIAEAYRGTAKDLTFDDEFVDRLLTTQKDDAMCFPILSLLMPDVDFTRALQKDHLHPAAVFQKDRLETQQFLRDNDEIRAFYENPENWNGIANLHLLDSSLNAAKQDKPLEDWLNSPGLPIGRENLMIPGDVGLSFEDFPTFISRRKETIKRRLTRLMLKDSVDQEQETL